MNENEPDGQIETVPALAAGSRVLPAPEFQGSAAMPAEMEWSANIDNPRNRKADRMDVTDFIRFVGIRRSEEFVAAGACWNGTGMGRCSGMRGLPSTGPKQ